MAKLEGVKTLDMVNGEITKIEYNGEVYEKVETPKKGDIGWIRGYEVYVEILEIDDVGDPVVADEYGSNWFAHALSYFRKPSAPSLKAGDKVRLISNNPKFGFGRARVGDVGEVQSVTGEVVVVDFPNHTCWNGIMADLELVEEVSEEEAQPTKELFAKVNRPNNIPIPGDYVTFKLHEDMYYVTKGKKYKVVDEDGELEFKDDDGDFIPIVIEEVRTIDEIFVKYTKEQAEQRAKKGDKILVVDDKATGGLYGNGDILTASSSNSAGVDVEESRRGLWNEEFIVLNPDQIGESTEAEAEAVEETEVGEAPFEVGQFVVAEDNDRYTLTIPEAGALEVVEVGEFTLGGDIRVKFHREFTDGNGITAHAGVEYSVNSVYFRLATDEEIVEALGLNEVKEGDRVEVLAEDHHLVNKGDTFTVTDVDNQGVFGENVYAAFASNGKPRIKLVEEGEKQPEIKPGDYVINHQGTLGRVDVINSGFYLGEWLYNEEYPEDFPLEMSTINAIERLATPEEIAEYEAYKAKQDEQVTNPETIEEGDLVRVIESPFALPNGSVFKVTKVQADGTIRGKRKDSDIPDYYYEPKHVELVAKAEDVYV